jgi:uncharacterized protein
MKLIVFGLVAYAIYYFFFRKTSVIDNQDNQDNSETMIECEECHTYIAIDEAVVSHGHYYCSKSCAKLK